MFAKRGGGAVLPIPLIGPGRGDRGRPMSPVTQGLTRGVCRLLTDLGYGPITEFRLPNSRRVDVIGLDAASRFVIVEVKSSPADFRGDSKWPDYLPWCDRFFFAVSERFPLDLIPQDCGLIVADAWGAAIRREAPELRLHPNRRRAQMLRFALTASERLQRLADPRL